MKARTEQNQRIYEVLKASQDYYNRSLPEAERKIAEEEFEELYRELEADGTFDRIDEEMDRLFAPSGPRKVNFRLVK